MNMLRHIVLVIAGTLSVVAIGAEPSATVPWKTSPRDAVAAARQNQRPLLIYFTVDTCGYCRKLEQITWSDSDVRTIVSTRFVPLKVNGEHQTKLVDVLNVQGFPTTIVISPAGQELGRVTGYADPETMSAKLREALRRQTAAAASLSAEKFD